LGIILDTIIWRLSVATVLNYSQYRYSIRTQSNEVILINYVVQRQSN
jgi:hypothetical protein